MIAAVPNKRPEACSLAVSFAGLDEDALTLIALRGS